MTGGGTRWRALRPFVPTVLVALAAAGVGAAYAHFVGCRTGTCPITSSAWRASLYGASVGVVAAWPARRRSGSAGAGGAQPSP
jgi:hypothetical protein